MNVVQSNLLPPNAAEIGAALSARRTALQTEEGRLDRVITELSRLIVDGKDKPGHPHELKLAKLDRAKVHEQLEMIDSAYAPDQAAALTAAATAEAARKVEQQRADLVEAEKHIAALRKAGGAGDIDGARDALVKLRRLDLGPTAELVESRLRHVISSTYSATQARKAAYRGEMPAPVPPYLKTSLSILTNRWADGAKAVVAKRLAELAFSKPKARA